VVDVGGIPRLVFAVAFVLVHCGSSGSSAVTGGGSGVRHGGGGRSALRSGQWKGRCGESVCAHKGDARVRESQ
jgi:hypothetical protein